MEYQPHESLRSVTVASAYSSVAAVAEPHLAAIDDVNIERYGRAAQLLAAHWPATGRYVAYRALAEALIDDVGLILEDVVHFLAAVEKLAGHDDDPNGAGDSIRVAVTAASQRSRCRLDLLGAGSWTSLVPYLRGGWPVVDRVRQELLGRETTRAGLDAALGLAPGTLAAALPPGSP